MKPTSIALFAALVTWTQFCGAIQPGGMAPPARAGSETALVERGGTIDAVDARKPALVVDGVAYSVPTGSIPIHTLSNRVSGSLAELKPGMQVRFSSSTDGASNQLQVREVWVTGEVRRPARSPRER